MEDLNLTQSRANKKLEEELLLHKLDSTDPRTAVAYTRRMTSWLSTSYTGGPWAFLGDGVLSGFEEFLVKQKKYVMNPDHPLEYWYYEKIRKAGGERFVTDFLDLQGRYTEQSMRKLQGLGNLYLKNRILLYLKNLSCPGSRRS